MEWAELSNLPERTPAKSSMGKACPYVLPRFCDNTVHTQQCPFLLHLVPLHLCSFQ